MCTNLVNSAPAAQRGLRQVAAVLSFDILRRGSGVADAGSNTAMVIYLGSGISLTNNPSDFLWFLTPVTNQFANPMAH
jgi:hypothetical protein